MELKTYDAQPTLCLRLSAKLSTLPQLGEIEQTFFAQLGESGLKPAGETREVSTHFVEGISADNVTHTQVGI